MLGPSWIALFERIPASLHDSLALTLVTGAEIIMQSVLKLESDFAIIRGRMSGSTDAGRVLILPYNQIVNLAFTKRMLVPDVQAVFGQTLESAATSRESERSEGEAVETPAENAPEDAAEAADPPSKGVAVEMRTAQCKPPPAPASAAAGKSQPPSKSILLARLRARLAEKGK